MSNRRFRAGILGCGRIASGLDDPWFDKHVRDESWRARPCTHAGVYAAHPRIELAAGADDNEERLTAFSRLWGVGGVYRDYREMLRREELDIVSVTPACPLHAEMTIAAAEAGAKAILCEKPIACSLQEADAMIRACDAHGTRLIVNHCMRLSPYLQVAKATVAAGAIGELKTIACYFDRWLLHMGSHLFDVMCLFAGEPKWVFGQIYGDDTVDADGSGYIQFGDGVVGLFDARSKIAPGFLELMGTRGLLLYCDDSDYTLEFWMPVKCADPHTQLRNKQPQPFPLLPGELQDAVPRQGRFVTRYAVDEVIACIEQNRESISSARDARWALEIALAVYHSHRQGGKRVELPLADRSLWMPESRPFPYPQERT